MGKGTTVPGDFDIDLIIFSRCVCVCVCVCLLVVHVCVLCVCLCKHNNSNSLFNSTALTLSNAGEITSYKGQSMIATSEDN